MCSPSWLSKSVRPPCQHLHPFCPWQDWQEPTAEIVIGRHVFKAHTLSARMQGNNPDYKIWISLPHLVMFTKIILFTTTFDSTPPGPPHKVSAAIQWLTSEHSCTSRSHKTEERGRMLLLVKSGVCGIMSSAPPITTVGRTERNWLRVGFAREMVPDKTQPGTTAIAADYGNVCSLVVFYRETFLLQIQCAVNFFPFLRQL